MSIMADVVNGNAIGSAFRECRLWMQDYLSNPLTVYILWHLLLLLILLMLFFDSRNGFRGIINICTRVFLWFRQNSIKNSVEHTVSDYRERAKKVYLGSSLATIAIILVIASVLYFKLIFFSVVISDSMNPALKKGDLILMQNIIVKPEVGDIIIFKVEDEQLPITHRIVSISGNEIRVKGDANPNPDPWRVSREQILGMDVRISGKPVVLRDVGDYFLVDASEERRTYGPEFNAVASLIKGVKAAGFLIFLVCIILYLALSVRDSVRTR